MIKCECMLRSCSGLQIQMCACIHGTTASGKVQLCFSAADFISKFYGIQNETDIINEILASKKI